MKFGKKLLSLFLSIVMLMSMLGTTALAAGGSTNVEFTVDKPTAAVGDTITVVFKNKEMTVSSFTGGIMFDKSKLECTSVAGPIAGYYYLTVKNPPMPAFAYAMTNAVSTVEQANTAGTVGFGYAGASDVEYAASDLYTATFKVKEGATGTVTFTLYEDTAGTDEYKSDSIETKSVIISGGTTPPALTPVTSASFTMTGYEVGKKITDIAVSGTNTGLVAIGGTEGKGYKNGYVIYTDEGVLSGDYSSHVNDTSDEKFEANKHYYLLVLLEAKDGYSITGLTKENVKLGTKTAEKLLEYGSTTAAVFKLDQLTTPAHTHSKGTLVPEVPATCTSTGTKAYYPCTGCDAKLDADGKEITDLTLPKNPNAHSFGALVPEVPANCMETGTKAHKDCSLCGKHFDNSDNVITDLTIAKDSNAHKSGCTLGDWQKNDTKHWKEYSLCHTKANEAEHSFAADATICSAGCGQTRKLTQTITAENVAFTYHDTPTKIIVNGAKTDVTFEVIEGKDVVISVAADGTPDYSKAGTAKVKITAAANDTYYAAETTVTVTINKKPITIVSATAIPRDYQQGVKTVEIAAVSFDAASIGGSEQIELSGVMDDDKAGIDKVVHVTVTLKGIAANNYSLAVNTFDTKVTINKADPTAPTNLKGKTGNTLSSVELPEGWSWVAPNTELTEGLQTYKANYAGSTNYKSATDVDVKVTVSDKLTQTLNVPATINATYGDTNVSVAPTGAHGALSYAVASGADVVTVGSDGKLTILKAGKATVTVTAAETADYASATEDVTVNVSKKSLTVTAKSQSIYVNGTAPDLTAADAYTVSGLVTGDTAPTVSLVYSETPDVTKTGSYDIIVTVTGVDTDKYALTAVDGKLTISNRPSSSGKTYAITVESAEHGTVKADRKNAGAGTKINVTVAADKGYTLETLTVLDKNGKEVKLTAKDGKYSFTMPASKVTVKATFAEDNSMLNFFVDVPADEYYADPVLWAAENGITGGMDATHFAPDMTCTRAQAVTFLWRAAGCPAPKSTEMPFADVVSGSYYYDAVLWAVENGITKGTSETTFSPDADCSRAQIVTFLWRSQKSPAASAANPFADVSADAYYANAVLWAVKNGVTTGTAAVAFSPDAYCTRAQIVTFIYRCMK